MGKVEPRRKFLDKLIYKEMEKHHWRVVLAQVGCTIIFAKTPAYGIPPFLWETYDNGRFNHWQTLQNYLQWVKDMS